MSAVVKLVITKLEFTINKLKTQSNTMTIY